MERSMSFPVYTPSFWRDYVIQMRPYLLFVSGVAGILGVALSATSVTPSWKVVAAFIPFFLGYGFGQALTDCFQTDTDKLSAPYRPLSQGRITIASTLTVSLAGLILCGIILFLLNPLTLWLCLISVFALATYSFVKRNFWYAGPFYNAGIVALLPVMGYFSVMDMMSLPPTSLLLYAAITFFSYSNFVLIGYLKDIEADRATGYKTFPVIFGWKRTVIVGDIFALATIVLFWTTNLRTFVAWGVGALATIIVITGLRRAHLAADRNERGALIPILSTVRSFVLFHIALILEAQPRWAIAMGLFYILFEVALYRRPSRYQV